MADSIRELMHDGELFVSARDLADLIEDEGMIVSIEPPHGRIFAIRFSECVLDRWRSEPEPPNLNGKERHP